MPNCKWYHKDEPDIMQIFKLHFQGGVWYEKYGRNKNCAQNAKILTVQ